MDNDSAPSREPKPDGVTISKGTVRLFQAAAAVIVLAGVGFLAFTLLSSGETTLTGTLDANECGGGFDIENSTVKVLDESGNVVGATTTSGNTPDPNAGNRSTGCHVEFEVDVKDAEFYELSIGTHGGPTYTKDELEAQDWHVELEL